MASLRDLCHYLRRVNLQLIRNAVFADADGWAARAAAAQAYPSPSPSAGGGATM